MPAFAAARREWPRFHHRAGWITLEGAAAVALAFAVALQFHLVLTRAINWDEFYFYSQVVQVARGDAIHGLNTIHTRLFAWLLWIDGDAIDRILIARQVMFAAELVTLAMIAAIAAHFADRRTGLVAALGYLSWLYVFQHGFAFRVDPLAAACGMAALYLLVVAPLNWRTIAAFALLAGFGGMITIKLALFAPAFAGAWLYRLLGDWRWRTGVTLAAMPLAGACVFAALYLLHAPQSSAEATRVAAQFTESSARYVFSAPTDYHRYFLHNMARSPVASLIVLALPFALWHADFGRNAKIGLAGMAACLAAFAVYKNALPYFFPFILPPVMAAGGIAVAHLMARGWTGPLLLGLLANVMLHWVLEPRSPLERQRQIVAAADAIFPTPVEYFDFPAMLSHFPKANPFMTTWGISSYMAQGAPIYRERMQSSVVPLVLASEQAGLLTLERLMTTRGPSPHFLPEDAEALRANYLRFWGPYWLAGKRIPAGRRVNSEFLVPGPYTVHAGPVTVDNRAYRPGDVIHLARGVHVLESTTGANLFWGDRLQRPQQPAPARPYWTDF